MNSEWRIVNSEWRIVTILALALWLLVPSSPVYGEFCRPAQDQLFLTATATEGITVIESKVSHSFARQAVFTLQATSSAEINRVYLFFRAIGDEQTESVLVDVEPSREISINYVHDLRRSPLPPFATVIFWWYIEDTADHDLTTDYYQFEYTDDRFQWEQISDRGITIHWIEGHGDPIFGQAALDVALASVEEISADLRAPVPESIAVYIYDVQHNLETAMALTGRSWVVGQAHPELGVIVVAIPYDATEGYMSRVKRYIPHEITHLLVYQTVTPAGYRYVPEWLDEGLSTANEWLPTVEFTTILEEARTQGQLLSLESMCVPFSPDLHTALLSYAQSGSIVQFIREQYGARGIRDLLAAYADGASCTMGVQEALDVSLGDLESAWWASLEPQTPWRALVDKIGVWVGLWLLSLLPFVPMISRLRRNE